MLKNDNCKLKLLQGIKNDYIFVMVTKMKRLQSL